MVVRRRLYVMMSAMAVSCLLVMLLYWLLLQRNVKGFVAASNEEARHALASILELEGKVMRGMAFDYTYWTEMVDFAKSGDEEWAAQNLDARLPDFNCDACWVFKKDFTLTAYREIEGAGLESDNIGKQDCERIFSSEKFPHWFARVGCDIVEFRGAVIQPSSDIERVTPPQGYFILARIWGQDRLSVFKGLFSANEVEISDRNTPAMEHPHNKTGCSWHLFEMPVLEGSPAIVLRAVLCRPRIDHLIQMSSFASVAISILLVLTVALFIMGLSLWVSMPISLMSEALQKQKPELVEPLISRKNELGRLAELIKRFFVQQIALEKEVAHRKDIQAKQERFNNMLRIWGSCNLVMATQKTEDQMLEDICGIIVQHSGYMAAWIGEVTWKGAKASVAPLAKAGNDAGYLNFMRQHLKEDALRATCVVGSSLRSKDVTVCRGIDELQADCENWKKEAARRGIQAAACFPMLQQGEVFAVLVVFSSEKAHLDIEERKVLSEVSENLAAGIQLVRSEKARREAEKKADDLTEQLMRTQKMEAVGRLAGGVAHDFNNLLFVIMGNLELCLSGKGMTACKRELSDAMEACRQASMLTQQLLALGRRRVEVAEAVNVNYEIEKAIDLIKSSFKENVDLKLVLDSKVGPVLGDPTQIRQIFMNIAVNAGQAMPNGGTLTITTESVCVEADFAPDTVPGDYVLIAMADTGEGIEDEVLQHVFEPFFSTREAGSGLGLALVNSIVSQHSGFVRISTVKGGGTTVRVFLPIADVVPGGESEISRTPALRAKGGETVLLVEERDMCRLLTKTMLETLGYKVIEAASPNEAIEKGVSEGKGTDVILTDVVMPGMSGPEMVDILHNEGVDGKVVYMSGYADGVLAEHGLSGTRVGLLQKPFMLSQLAQIVREAIMKG